MSKGLGTPPPPLELSGSKPVFSYNFLLSLANGQEWIEKVDFFFINLNLIIRIFQIF